MVVKKTNFSYYEMGIGEGVSSGDDTLRLRRTSQSATSPALMMDVWASVASWFFRPEAGALPPLPSTPSSGQGLPVPPAICTAIRCTVPGCSCECFTPGKQHIRFCENCSHGWVPHALDKLGFRQVLGQVEPVQPNVAFDIASLVLYGCQALPIRLKILLDRLFSVLQREEVIQVLRGFGWTQEDYNRGYILQEPHGAVLDRWNICSPEEEPLVLQQFLRFGETRAITEHLLLHGLPRIGEGRLPRKESEIKRFFERAASNRKEEQKMSIKSSQSLQLLQDQRQLERREREQHFERQQQQLVHQPPTSLRSNTPPIQKQPPTPSPVISSIPFLKLPTTNGPITSSPPSSISSSPISVSPLNRLQNMQPFDFRKMASIPPVKGSPERRRISEASDSSPPGLINLSVTSPAPPPNSVPAPQPPHPPLPPVPPAVCLPTPLDLHSAAGSDMGSEDDDEDDDDSYSALNLSRDAPRISTGRPGRPPGGGHPRKASTPVKRQWGSSSLPLNLGTQLINPATGKKRVQCNVCLKTFCDKGALKIHFSAVHLREMHKCTVEGCNMMFSSRRSRNRHSANPNPKLHSPHLRRKISPHDGRSAQSHTLLIPPLPASALNPLSFGSFPLLTPPPQSSVLDLKQSLDLSLGRKDSISEDYLMDDDEEEGIVVVGEDEENYDKRSESGRTEDGSTKKLKLSESDVDMDEYNEDSNEDSSSVRPEASSKVTRKRKSQNPTRCAQPQVMTDDEGMMTDEESSGDVVFRGLDEAHNQNNNEDKTDKSNVNQNEGDENGNNTEDSGKLSRLEKINQQENHIQQQKEQKPSTQNQEPQQNHEKQKNNLNEKNDYQEDKSQENEQHNEANREDEHIKGGEEEEEEKEERENEASYRGEKKDQKNEVREEFEKDKENKKDDVCKNEESVDSCNALRQLENLSQGHFGEPESPARSQSRGSSGSTSDCNSDDNGDLLYGHFQDGAFIRAMDVPIDKDNPRMCTACGKVFQNHFGVKTHYQNVHLKLMHKCTVEGCNAAFPSKRSRDRHSANLNLHRKLLSTSLGDKAGSMFLEGSGGFHNEFLSRFYDPAALGPPHLPPPGLLNGDRLTPHPPLFMPPIHGFFPHLGGPRLNGHSSGSNSPPSPASPAACQDEEIHEKDGFLPCRFCQKSLPGRPALQEHYLQFHSNEMMRCIHPGCGLSFPSQRRRDFHSENECIHRQNSS